MVSSVRFVPRLHRVKAKRPKLTFRQAFREPGAPKQSHDGCGGNQPAKQRNGSTATVGLIWLRLAPPWQWRSEQANPWLWTRNIAIILRHSKKKYLWLYPNRHCPWHSLYAELQLLTNNSDMLDNLYSSAALLLAAQIYKDGQNFRRLAACHATIRAPTARLCANLATKSSRNGNTFFLTSLPRLSAMPPASPQN